MDFPAGTHTDSQLRFSEDKKKFGSSLYNQPLIYASNYLPILTVFFFFVCISFPNRSRRTLGERRHCGEGTVNQHLHPSVWSTSISTPLTRVQTLDRIFLGRSYSAEVPRGLSRADCLVCRLIDVYQPSK